VLAAGFGPQPQHRRQIGPPAAAHVDFLADQVASIRVSPCSPINLPRIFFISGWHGPGGHAGSSEGKDSLQMSLFEEEGGDRE
jgi:hypothetical protein